MQLKGYDVTLTEEMTVNRA